MKAVLYGDSLRYEAVSERYYSLLDKKKAESQYRRLFSRPDYFTFIITGDIAADDAKALCEQYVASIPGPKGYALTARIKDRGLPFPGGKIAVTVKKGLEEQGQALLVFGGQNPPPLPGATGEVERALLSAMTNLVEIRLRESLRETMGGTYGVGVSATLSTFPSRRFLSQVSFGMEPKRAETLVAALTAELASLQTTEASAADMGKVRETFIRERETAVKTNAFWHGTLLRHASVGETSAEIADQGAVLAQLTGETMRRLIGEYFPLDNYVQGLLLPE
jgi:zinc protease